MTPALTPRVGARLFAVTIALALMVSTVLTSNVASANEEGFTLTILHNNDGESELIGSDTEGGVARFSTLVNQAKREALADGGGVVLLSSGDNFLASPAFAASVADGVFYDALALSSLRYDAIDIGNHDFDFGPDVLEEFILDFRRPGDPPYLSANLDFTGEAGLQGLVDAGIIAGSTVVVERGRRIGVIGATTENLTFISSPRDVIVNEVLPAVQAEIDRLNSRNVDIIILISHLQDIDGDVELATMLDDVDVMIAGGGDELLANPTDLLLPSDDPADIFGPYPVVAVDAGGDDVPVVTTSGQYGYLGRLVVDFDSDGNVVSWSGGPLRVVDESVGSDGVADDARLVSRVVDPVASFVENLALNVIAQTEVELDGRRSPGVRTMETNEGNLIADSQLWAAQAMAADFGVDAPQVALQNGGGIRNDSIIAAGADPGATVDITELDTFDMVPFPNFVTVFEDIPRDQFKAILENAVSRTQPTDTPGGTGRFAQVAGFSFTYSASGIAMEIDDDGTVLVDGTRIIDVTLDDGTQVVIGGVVQAGDPIDLAIVDFLARGGDQYPFGDLTFTAVGISYQQALFNYIVAPVADGGLGGLITETDYPEGGEGRIVELP